MVDFFDKLYGSITDKNKILTRIRFYSVLRLIIRVTANILIPFWFTITFNKKGFVINKKSKTNENIIVSLTSFPQRINNVWVTIESILRQTHRPDKIILWLSLKQFSSIAELPAKLLRLQARGLQIELVDNDLRSHKKYYYALKLYPNDVLVTIDDDIIYPSCTIEELINWHEIYPNTVIARYGLKINIKGENIFPYHTWANFYQQERPSFEVFFGSGGGTLFPPFCMHSDVVDQDLPFKLCPQADDIWLNTMCRLNNTKIFKPKPGLRSLLSIINKNNVTLSKRNVNENYNDEQLRNVRDYYIAKLGLDPYLDIVI